MDIGYKPFFDLNNILTDKETQEEIVKYLNSKFSELELKKPIFSIPKGIYDVNILQISEKSKSEPSVLFSRTEDNMCSLLLPCLSTNADSIELGVISNESIIGIPDATLGVDLEDGNSFELRTANNDKYNIKNEEGIWTVYSESIEMVDVTKEDIIEAISNLQEDIQTVPIKEGFFSYTYAFNNSPMGMLAQDMQQLTLLIQRLMREEMKGEWEKYVPLAFAVLIIVVAIIAIVTTLGSGGGGAPSVPSFKP